MNYTNQLSNPCPSVSICGSIVFSGIKVVSIWTLAAVMLLIAGCGTARQERKKDDFFTSGSREADQRASQRMAKAEQLSGSGEGSGEKGVKQAVVSASTNETSEVKGTNKAARVEGKLALYDRLGSTNGIVSIVDDFMARVLQDPRVNWQRKDINTGGLGIFHKNNDSVPWNETKENVANLKKHMVQFLTLATGGPAKYDGKEMKTVHAGMHIGNPEFDAALGDLKASLDKLRVPNKEQKELLSIIESTRPQIVTDRK